MSKLESLVSRWHVDGDGGDPLPEFPVPDGVLNAVDGAFWVLDRQCRLRAWNDRTREVLGYGESDLSGVDAGTFVAEDDRDAFAALLDRVATGGRADGELDLLTEAGERIPCVVTAAPLGDDGTVRAAAVTFRDCSEDRERERLLERYEKLLETAGDGMYVLDEDRYVEWADENLAALGGYEVDDLVGKHLTELITPEAADRGQTIRSALRRGDHDVATMTSTLIRKDGQRLPVEARFSYLPDEEGSTVGIVWDVSDRGERAALFEGLHDATRELMNAETKREVAETAAEVAYEYTDIATVGVRLLEDGELRMVAIATEDERLEEFPPPYEVGEGFVGEAYEMGEPVVYEQGVGDRATPFDYSPVESAMLIPIQGYGMINLASLEPDAFEETTRELGLLFAADVESALRRADREERLRERERELQAQRDELETLNRINELFQETIRALASAATREEIESTVCERLAASPFYLFAWTGARSTGDRLVEPRTCAGASDGYLESVEIPSDDADLLGPAADALSTGDVVLVDDIESDPRFEPWREPALERGFRSVAVVPFKHGETIHGLLAVYADRPAAFADRERRAFQVLGEMVGFAISATQHRRLIEAETALELELRLPDSEAFFARMAAHLGCTCRLLGSVPSGDAMTHYVSVSGAATDEVESYLADADSDRLHSVRVVRSTADGCVLSIQIEGSVPEVLNEAGAQTVGIVAGPDETRVVVRTTPDADVRAIVESFGHVYGTVELEAKREVQKDSHTAETLQARLDDRLTDRQREALSAAHFGGYYEWPRDSSAEAIAESLGISSATLHQHLRHAQRKLVAAYFDSSGFHPGP